MTFKTQMAADMQNVFTNSDEFGDVAIYANVAGVTTADVPIVIAKGTNFQEMGYHGGQAATIVIPTANVAAPEIGGTLTVGSEVYRIDQIANQDSAATTVTCALDQRQTPQNLQGA